MSVVTTAIGGDDLNYVWHNQAGGHPEAGYYAEAADAVDQGRWYGEGLADLGLREGDAVDRDDYDQVYRQVNPADGSVIGRKRGAYPVKSDHLEKLLAAEPHATAERRIELEREAAKATRRAHPYTDMTVSWSKSVSLLEASLRANARAARAEGDTRGAAQWDARLDRLHEILQDANRAGLEHVQQWAGITRTGHHGARVDGQEPGRYTEAGIVVSSWLQGLSRAGSPQLHIHNQIARMVQTYSDGQWRTLDTMSLRAQIDAVTAITAAYTEAGLTREFGVEWVARADGKGNEIRGVTDAEIKLFSERTRDITRATQQLARDWTARHGRAPTEYELLHIQKRATMRTRQPKEHDTVNWDDRTDDWDARLVAKLGERLADIAPRVMKQGPVLAAGPAPSLEKQRQAVKDAVEILGSKRSTWTRAEFARVLQTVLPPEVSRMDPREAACLVDDLAAEATSGRVGEVVPMEAPEWPALPDALRREVDGRSVYTRPGVERYAARASVDLEQQLVADSQRQVAPTMTREEIATAWGTEPDRLEAVLQASAEESTDRLENGLRLDQGAALLHVLSSARVCEVLVGPAGTGKTRSAAEAASLWARHGGQVIGTATSQNATNELAEAGFRHALNTTRLLHHLDEIAPGTLIWVDEGSMVSMEHLARIVEFAASHGCKVVVSGDQQQLAAVEAGGGMMLLVNRNGCVQLSTPQRFQARWEQAASLRLRDGDATAIDEYQAQGRIRGGDPVQVMREATRAYVAEHIAGHDVILTALSWDRCRELSRMVRGDLQHLGLVDDGRTVELSEGQEASAGDLIIARENDHDLEAGEEDRGLANGDVMRIERVTDGGLVVRRVTGTDDNGQRTYSDEFTYRALGTTDLAYAKTGHAAQGETVHSGFTVVTGSESRQWLYSAMTRGRWMNLVFTVCRPRKADPAPEPVRPAPELKRQEAEDRFRAGWSAEDEPEEEREAVAVLSDVIDHDGTQLAALEMRLRNASNADHIGKLNAVWEDLTRGAQDARYERVLREALPPDVSSASMGPTAKWLWRTMAQAEAAGLDVRETVRQAVEMRSMAGAEDVAAVIHTRLRPVVEHLVPLGPRSWEDRTPELADQARDRYAQEVARAMDARAGRLGEHTAEQQPAWLVNALGPVPEDPVARLDYEHRAGKIAVYRELYGFDHPTEAIGAEPTWDSPDKRSHWQAAAMARSRVDEVDLTERSDASLHHMRRSYEAITRTAPEHPGRVLQETRVRRDDAGRQAQRAEAEAVAARGRQDEAAAERHDAIGRVCRSAGALHADHERIFAEQAGLRDRWARLTEGSRMLAVAADGELRKRHPGQQLDPLRSAEPVISEQDRAELTYVPNTLESPEVVGRISGRQAEHEDQLAQMEAQTIPDEDAEVDGQERAWGEWIEEERGTVLQRPVEVVPPAPEVDEIEIGRWS